MNTSCKCRGCIDNQANQEAHMGRGGCLAQPGDWLDELMDNDEQDNDEQDNDEPNNSSYNLSDSDDEEEKEKEKGEEICSICYDVIGTTNITITECCHKFHSSCIFRNLLRRLECPMCRVKLVTLEEEEEEDDEILEEEDDETN